MSVKVKGRLSAAFIEASKCPTRGATPTLPRTLTSGRSSCRQLPDGGRTSEGCHVLEDVSFGADQIVANVRHFDSAASEGDYLS